MNFYQRLQTSTSNERMQLIGAPIVAAALEGRVTRELYLSFLTRAYHHVRHTPRLLMACGARIPEGQEWLRTEISHYIEEEVGHDEWILDDIAAAGGDAESVRCSAPDFDTDLMVAYAYDTVNRRNPVGFFGMVFVLEGTSVSLASKVAAAVQRSLGLSKSAFTYLNSHGALDVEHIGNFEKIVDRLEAEADRVCVEQSAKVFFRLYGNVLANIGAKELP